jgi:6-phosphogluconate dehydrogenase (decarboxylating)
MYTIAKRFAFSASHVIGGLHTFAQKVLSRTRQGFGGHNEAKSHASNRMEDKA